ncbi:MAG: D-alanine--D-alanine ligase [Oscillospiraceae bacterium]|nr:D-alanine--D-alanine ligase [Oscillospiraceae bacterium]
MKKLGIIFGGQSTEHDVSIMSAASIIKNLDKTKYDITQIYISKDGNWNIHNKIIDNPEVGERLTDLTKIDNVMEELRKLDVLFPVLHGKNGEDGTIQGFFELIGVPYVGCRVLSSSLGMDKAYTKVIFEKAKINQAPYVYIRKGKDKYIYVDSEFNETIFTLDEVSQLISEKIKFPMFVKPSNSGSSVGINKSKNVQDLKENIAYASKFDNKIIIEEGLVGRELECSVLGNEEVVASCVGEIIPADEFYSFDAKYINNTSKGIAKADIKQEHSEEIRRLAIKAFKAIDGKGLARVDFFLDEAKNKIYINEINTLPGFTQISMYPKMWEESGISYKELLEKIIDLA